MVPSPVAAPAERKPRDDEIDVYGLTHPGKVRAVNQDHFLLAQLRRQIDVLLTSLPRESAVPPAERLAFLALVADGVGGSEDGEEASRVAAAAATAYVTGSMACYFAEDAADEERFAPALAEAARRAHEQVVARAAEAGVKTSMATTLTLWIGVWPHAYLLQVGDSRCYHYVDGKLLQVSRDQTMAQALVDQGILTSAQAPRTQWANILSSSIGGSSTEPVVTRFRQVWGSVGLLCSDGLTKHVPDERIAERLRTMTSARQACEALLQDALDGGGTDNITIVIGRTIRRDPD